MRIHLVGLFHFVLSSTSPIHTLLTQCLLSVQQASVSTIIMTASVDVAIPDCSNSMLTFSVGLLVNWSVGQLDAA